MLRRLARARGRSLRARGRMGAAVRGVEWGAGELATDDNHLTAGGGVVGEKGISARIGDLEIVFSIAQAVRLPFVGTDGKEDPGFGAVNVAVDVCAAGSVVWMDPENCAAAGSAAIKDKRMAPRERDITMVRRCDNCMFSSCCFRFSRSIRLPRRAGWQNWSAREFFCSGR